MPPCVRAFSSSWLSISLRDNISADATIAHTRKPCVEHNSAGRDPYSPYIGTDWRRGKKKPQSLVALGKQSPAESRGYASLEGNLYSIVTPNSCQAITGPLESLTH